MFLEVHLTPDPYFWEEEAGPEKQRDWQRSPLNLGGAEEGEEETAVSGAMGARKWGFWGSDVGECGGFIETGSFRKSRSGK